MSDTQEKMGETGNYRDEKGRLLPGHPGFGGRPKGLSLLSILKDKLQKTILTDKGEITVAEEIIDNYIAKAKQGDEQAYVSIRDILNRIDGMPTQTVVSVSDEESAFVKAVKEIKDKLQSE